MKMFYLCQRTAEPISRWPWSSPATCRQRPSARMTFDMKVKASGGPGAAGNTTC